MAQPRLVVVPALPAAQDADKVIITRKFIDGVCEYQRLWPGPVSVLMAPAKAATNNLDNESFRLSDLPFDLTVAPLDSFGAIEALQSADVALLSADYRQMHLANVCRRMGVPSVYVSEYSLRTRLQVVRVEAKGPLRAARRALWELRQEGRIRRAIATATAVQCNGLPTYDAYRGINPHALLFFDTRVTAKMLAPEEALHRRFAARRQRDRLHLAFSGRFLAMKGVDHLVRVAAELREMGRRFTFSLCGAGPLEPQIRRDIERLGLLDLVEIKGNLGFETELIPFMRDEVDLFVCCHPQGDPSCTYLETMACGVPIIGYANEAWAGLLNVSGAGWASPLGDPKAMARRIGEISDSDLDRHSLASLRFAKGRTFEAEFQRRVEHLQEAMRVAA